MSITVMLNIKIKENSQKEFEELMKVYLVQTRQYKGFQKISIYKDEDSNNVVFYSIWDSKKDYENYFNWRMETGVLTKIASVSESEPQLSFYTDLQL